MTLETAHLPLRDVRVLDLCVGTGELASRYLADLGADVVRLEPSSTGGPRGQAEEDVFFRATHSANKRSRSLDLRTDANLEAFWARAAAPTSSSRTRDRPNTPTTRCHR